MARLVTVAAAQLGPIARAATRSQVVDRLLALLHDAHAMGATLVVYPELALTTFFPRWFMTDQAEIDAFFETAMPGPQTQRLFDAAARLGVGFCLGYAELVRDGARTRRYNTAILVDRAGTIVGKYRKVHLPGHAEHDPERSHQHLEKRYFEPGDLGFPVWRMLDGVFGMCICNDRRWPETYRVMGLKGVEMVVLGFNTPSENAQKAGERPALRMFHHKLSLQAGAYQNSTWVVAVAKAGTEDGHHLMGGTVIVNPDGEVVAESKTEDDEIVMYDCDLDATTFGKETIFNFAQHRRIEHYGLIASQTGATPPEA